MLGAIAQDGFRGFMTYEGATTSEVFTAFIEQQVAPRLTYQPDCPSQQYPAHKSERVAQAILKKGASLLFLPPYSPDYNPIERLWSFIKPKLRKAVATTEEVDLLIATTMNSLHAQHSHFKAWILHAGYGAS